jgi:hypothetical protein
MIQLATFAIEYSHSPTIPSDLEEPKTDSGGQILEARSWHRFPSFGGIMYCCCLAFEGYNFSRYPVYLATLGTMSLVNR